MKNESLPFLTSFSQRIFLLTFLFILLFLSLCVELLRFNDFKAEELLVVQGKILNIYPKEDRDIFKVKTANHTFFTSSYKTHTFTKYDNINLTIITTHVEFIDFIKGFFVTSFNREISRESTFQDSIISRIKTQHQHHELHELFLALFMALPLSSVLRDFFATLGISHLIAISGFHLSVLSFVIYGGLNLCYKPLHQNFFPYRNKKFDLTVITACVLFAYLILTGFVPSLLRAFIMLLFAFILLRSNIKLFSFETLLYTLLVIIALFPSYAFSLSLWFSIMGVFYIFLFIKYFQNLPKLPTILIFNFWIFFCFNPIVHYFFTQTSLVQLISPIITIGFTFFYPLELLLHFIGYGGFLDEFLILFFSLDLDVYDITTPWWFFTLYVFISFMSIIYKEAFWLLNFFLLLFNGVIFLAY